MRGPSILDRFGNEPRFANACLTGDQNGLSMAAVGLFNKLNKRIKMRLATDEYGTDDRLRNWYCHYGCLFLSPVNSYFAQMDQPMFGKGFFCGQS